MRPMSNAWDHGILWHTIGLIDWVNASQTHVPVARPLAKKFIKYLSMGGQDGTGTTKLPARR
jgi:hypothetical protein